MAIDRELLYFDDEALNLLMSGCLTCLLLASNLADTLQRLRVKEAREVVRMENELSYIAIAYNKKRVLLLTSMKTSRFLVRTSHDREWEEACASYKKNLERIEENFRERCGVDTAAYNQGVASAGSSARDAIVGKLSVTYDVLVGHHHEYDAMLRSKEVVVDEMVHMINKAASWLQPTHSDNPTIDESLWIAKKFRAVSATLALEGKGELPVSVDKLLQARPSILHSISCLTGTSLITSQFKELDLGNDFSADEAHECLLKLAHALQAKSCSEAVGLERGRTRSFRKQPEDDYKVSSQRGAMYKAEVAMTLEEKRKVLDIDEKAVQERRERCYPNYSFICITHYFQKEQVNFYFLYDQSQHKMLETICQYCARTHMPAKDLLIVFRLIVKHCQPRLSSRHLTKYGSAVVPANVPYMELSVDSIGYIFAVKSPKVCHAAGLMDVHDGKVLLKGPNGLGVCPWCGTAFSVMMQLFAHVHREHYGIVLMCEVCHQYGSFDSDEVVEHIKKVHVENIGATA